VLLGGPALPYCCRGVDTGLVTAASPELLHRALKQYENAVKTFGGSVGLRKGNSAHTAWLNHHPVHIGKRTVR
jgi:hypothetical protein